MSRNKLSIKDLNNQQLFSQDLIELNLNNNIYLCKIVGYKSDYHLNILDIIQKDSFNKIRLSDKINSNDFNSAQIRKVDTQQWQMIN